MEDPFDDAANAEVVPRMAGAVVIMDESNAEGEGGTSSSSTPPQLKNNRQCTMVRAVAVNAADIANAHELARENDINIRARRFNERRDWLVREAFKHEIGKEVPQRAEKKLHPHQCKQK